MNVARTTIRAVVVDDEPLARDELTFLLEECGGVEVVGAARNAAAALEICEEHRPDVAFVDLRMPGPDGIALAEALRGRLPSLAVVVVSAHDDGAIRAYADATEAIRREVRLRQRNAAETKKITNIGSMTTTSGKFWKLSTCQFQKPPSWLFTMSARFIEPDCRITVMITRPIDTS